MTDQCWRRRRRWRWWWRWWWWWCESTPWRFTTTTWRPADTWHDDRNVFIKSRHRRDVTRMTYWRHTSCRQLAHAHINVFPVSLVFMNAKRTELHAAFSCRYNVEWWQHCKPKRTILILHINVGLALAHFNTITIAITLIPLFTDNILELVYCRSLHHLARSNSARKKGQTWFEFMFPIFLLFISFTVRMLPSHAVAYANNEPRCSLQFWAVAYFISRLRTVCITTSSKEPHTVCRNGYIVDSLSIPHSCLAIHISFLIPTLFIFIGIPPNRHISVKFSIPVIKIPASHIRNSTDSPNHKRRAQFAHYSAPLTSNIQ